MAEREELERQVRSVACRDQENRRQMEIDTQGTYRLRRPLVLRAERDGLARHVRSRARQDQENRRQMRRSTQVQQCFGKGHTIISSREGRGDEHPNGLAAPLVSLVGLVHLVCFVDLVDLVHLVCFIQPKNQTNQINKTNQRDQTDAPESLADFSASC